MAIRIAPISDQSTWDQFHDAHSPHALFSSFLWGEVQQKLGSKVTRFGYYNGDALVAIAQTVFVAAKRGKFIHVRHGPVLADPGNRQLWGEIVDHLKSEATKSGAWYIRMSPLLDDTKQARAILAAVGGRPAPIHAMDAEYCWVLDLSPSEDLLLSAMRKSTRYDIKRSDQLGVTITSSTHRKDLAPFFSLYKTTFERHGFVPHQGIEEEVSVFGAQKKALIVQAHHQGNILASAVILFDGNQAIYHHGASVPSKIPATAALQWYAMREAKKRGMKQYNFWGIAPPDKPRHPWVGITLFKQGFGGKAVQYVHAHDVPISPLYAIPYAVDTLRRMHKGY